ncbi:MAG: tripartite tricarboxylate transporter TctB family protein [Pseudomonadota bacterium]
MATSKSLAADLWVGTFIIAVCAAAIWEVSDLPPGTFEPLGSGPVPRWTAAIIIGLTLIAMFRAWRTFGRVQPRKDDVPPRWADASLIFALTIVYALLLHFRVARFDLLTTGYLFLTISLLVRFRRRSLPIIAIVSAIVGFGTHFAFTKVFVVDLPGAF